MTPMFEGDASFLNGQDLIPKCELVLAELVLCVGGLSGLLLADGAAARALLAALVLAVAVRV